MEWLERNKGGGITASVTSSNTDVERGYLYLNSMTNEAQTFVSSGKATIDWDYDGVAFSQLNIGYDDSFDFIRNGPRSTKVKVTVKRQNGDISNCVFNFGGVQKSPIDNPRVGTVNSDPIKVTKNRLTDELFETAAFVEDINGKYTEYTSSRDRFSPLTLPKPDNWRYWKVKLSTNTELGRYADLREIKIVEGPVEEYDADGKLITDDAHFYRKTVAPDLINKNVLVNVGYGETDISGGLSQDPGDKYQAVFKFEVGNYPIFRVIGFDVPNSGGVKFSITGFWLLEYDSLKQVWTNERITFVGGGILKKSNGAVVGWRPLVGDGFDFTTPIGKTEDVSFDVTREADYAVNEFPDIIRTTLRIYDWDISFIEDYPTHKVVAIPQNWEGFVADDPKFQEAQPYVIPEFGVSIPNSPNIKYVYVGRKYRDVLKDYVYYGSGNYTPYDFNSGNDIALPNFTDGAQTENTLSSNDANMPEEPTEIDRGDEIEVEVETMESYLAGCMVKLPLILPPPPKVEITKDLPSSRRIMFDDMASETLTVEANHEEDVTIRWFVDNRLAKEESVSLASSSGIATSSFNISELEKEEGSRNIRASIIDTAGNDVVTRLCKVELYSEIIANFTCSVDVTGSSYSKTIKATFTNRGRQTTGYRYKVERDGSNAKSGSLSGTSTTDVSLSQGESRNYTYKFYVRHTSSANWIKVAEKDVSTGSKVVRSSISTSMDISGSHPNYTVDAHLYIYTADEVSSHTWELVAYRNASSYRSPKILKSGTVYRYQSATVNQTFSPEINTYYSYQYRVRNSTDRTWVYGREIEISTFNTGTWNTVAEVRPGSTGEPKTIEFHFNTSTLYGWRGFEGKVVDENGTTVARGSIFKTESGSGHYMTAKQEANTIKTYNTYFRHTVGLTTRPWKDAGTVTANTMEDQPGG